MEKKPYKATKTRAPDLDRFIIPEYRRNFVTYAQGAKLYSLNYWTFVRLCKEAGASFPLRKTAIVDLLVLDAYMEETKREDEKTSKGVLMAKRTEIEQMDNLVRTGKKYMRIDEAKDYFSVGKHTVEKWAKQAKAVYKINGVKLVNIEKINRFIEAFEEVDDE